jgi:MFS family permease
MCLCFRVVWARAWVSSRPACPATSGGLRQRPPLLQTTVAGSAQALQSQRPFGLSPNNAMFLLCVALLLFLPFNGLVSIYIISALFGLFQGGIVPAYAVILREYFPAKEAGSRVGAVIMATLLGMGLGGWMSGKVFDLTGSYHAAFINGVLWNALNLSIALWLLWRVKRAAVQAA